MLHDILSNYSGIISPPVNTLLYLIYFMRFYYIFKTMEGSGVLDHGNRLQMFVLHLIYIPRINRTLESLVLAWNQHSMRTERNWSHSDVD